MNKTPIEIMKSKLPPAEIIALLRTVDLDLHEVSFPGMFDDDYDQDCLCSQCEFCRGVKAILERWDA